MNHDLETLLSFKIEELRLAIPINAIRTVIQSVAVTPVPDTGIYIYGMMDFRGTVIPVINLRPRFNLISKAIDINQQFIIVKKDSKRLAIVADTIDELLSPTELKISTVELASNSNLQKNLSDLGLEIIEFHSDEKGIIVIYEIEKLLGSEAKLDIDSFFSKREE